MLQIVIFQLIFLMIYELLLKNDTFFNWNRAYLLGTSVLSIILPFIKLQSFSKVIPTEYSVNLPAVIIGQTTPNNLLATENLDTIILNHTSINYVMLFWYIGVLVFSIILLYKLIRIRLFKHLNTSIKKQGYHITTLKNSEAAFSFLNIIFLGDQLKEDQKESILKHEKVHVQQKHTLDLLWFEMLRIIFWFNPLIYMYQKRITEVHEFIADKSASKQQQNYYENLLAKTFNVTQFSLVNQFYSSSLIKKRIIMLTKKQSNNFKLLKYITVIPIVLSMLVYVSCTNTVEDKRNVQILSSEENTVIENVITIVNNTATFEEFEKGLSEDQFNTIIGNLKVYKQMNSNKIENTDFNEYSLIWDKLYGNPIQHLSVRTEHRDLYYFRLANIFTEMLLKDIDNAIYELQGLMSMKMLLTPKIVNRLEKLNYVLPNKENYLKLVENTNSTLNSNSNEMTFKTLDQAPIFPGCEDYGTLEDLKTCFSKSISTHIASNFNTKLGDDLNLVGMQKIMVTFKVSTSGEINDVKVRAPHNVLAEEAKRVVKALPKLQPGMHNGKTVTVPYTLPIVFKIEA